MTPTTPRAGSRSVAELPVAWLDGVSDIALEALLRRMGLADRMNDRADSHSKGVRQRLMVARCLQWRSVVAVALEVMLRVRQLRRVLLVCARAQAGSRARRQDGINDCELVFRSPP